MGKHTRRGEIGGGARRERMIFDFFLSLGKVIMVHSFYLCFGPLELGQARAAVWAAWCCSLFRCLAALAHPEVFAQ